MISSSPKGVGEGESHMKETGMLVGKLELISYPKKRVWIMPYLTPKRD